MLLDDAGIEGYEIKSASRPSGVSELAKLAVGEGHRFLVAVGGDPIIHHVVNGMLAAQDHSDLCLAIIPGNSKNDFIKTFGLPVKVEDSIGHLKGEEYFAVDVGLITCQTRQGPSASYFVNLAEAGLGGEIFRNAAAMPAALSRVGELIAFWLSLARFKTRSAVVSLDHRDYEGDLTNLIVANGQFFREGLRLAPRAHPADGRFDCLLMIGGKADYVSALSRAQKGDHVPSPAIREYMSSKVEVRGGVGTLPIQADGVAIGRSPATFEIVPNAFRLKL